MSDADKEEKGSITIRVPSKAASALLIALAGTAWAKIEQWIDRGDTHRMQEGVYRVTADRIEEIYERLEACEDHVADAEPMPKTARLESLTRELVGSRGPASVVVEAVDMAGAEDEAEDEAEEAPDPVEVRVTYKKSRLPDFRNLQQRVQESGLEEIIQLNAEE